MIDGRLRSLPWRLALWLAAAQMIVAAVAAWIAVTAARDARVLHASERLRELNPRLKERYVAAIVTDDLDTLRSLVVSDSSVSGARVSVTDPRGRILAETEGAGAGAPIEWPEVREALDRGIGTRVRPGARSGSQTVSVAERLRQNGSTVAVVRTSLEISPGGSRLTPIVGAIALAGLASAALTTAGLFALAVRTVGQLRRVAHGARLFARGKLDRRIEPPAIEAFSPLADALNDMAAQLDQRIAQLEAQQADLNAILYSMASGVVALDDDERILNVNRAARQMFQAGHEVRGRLLQEVIRHPELHQLATDALAGRVPTPIELTISGSPPRHIRATTESLLGSDGRVRGLLMLLDDVTRLRLLESMRSDFAANVSHELRTPVTNIKGYVETLIDLGGEDPARTRQFLEVIRRNSERLSAIIEDVLALTQLESAPLADSVPLEPTPIERTVRAVVAQFTEAARAKRITLETELEPGLQPRLHPQLMEQALGNLVSNAINYSQPDTRVTIAARPTSGGGAEISVSDQGPGIAPDHLPRIFERFYRVDRGRSRDVGGTGLGLAIVKHIARAHHGTVEVESQVGVGSTFRITLPRPDGFTGRSTARKETGSDRDPG